MLTKHVTVIDNENLFIQQTTKVQSFIRPFVQQKLTKEIKSVLLQIHFLFVIFDLTISLLLLVLFEFEIKVQVLILLLLLSGTNHSLLSKKFHL